MKAKIYGYEFKPIDSFEHCRLTMASGKPLIGERGYHTYMETKLLLAHLGMKKAEVNAQAAQLTASQNRINDILGISIEMYLDVLNR